MPESETAHGHPGIVLTSAPGILGPLERFDAWHIISQAFADCRDATGTTPDVDGLTAFWPLGPFTFCRTDLGARRLFRSAAPSSKDQLDRDVVLLMLRSACQSAIRCGDTGPADEGGCCRSGYELRTIVPDPARWTELVCPPDLNDRLAELEGRAWPPAAGLAPLAQVLAQLVRSAAERLPQMTPADLPLIEQAVLCLLAASRNDPAAQPAAPTDLARQTTDRARAIAAIGRELSSARLTAERVSDLTGITRSSLYRLFAEDNGVASYIRILRLDALRGDLVDLGNSHRTVAELAESRGFYSLSTLNRAFRGRFGCTPGQIRTVASPADRL